MEHRTLAGVIFDLDGTLLDSTAVWSQIDRIILQEHGIQPPAGLSDLVKNYPLRSLPVLYYTIRLAIYAGVILPTRAGIGGRAVSDDTAAQAACAGVAE